MAFKYHQGIFTPKNPSKYVGNVDNIVYRSGWELTFMQMLDSSENVIRYASDTTGIVVPYYNELDKKMHKYFPDFVVTIIEKSLEVTYMIEIKPAKQTVPPKYRNSKKYLSEMFEYKKNQFKWKAAQTFCKKRNWKFMVVTEHWSSF